MRSEPPLSAEPVVEALVEESGEPPGPEAVRRAFSGLRDRASLVTPGRRLRQLLVSGEGFAFMMAVLRPRTCVPFLLYGNFASISALLLRGGTSLASTGIGVRTASGAQASRVTCLYRSLWSWLPSFGLCLPAFAHGESPGTGSPEGLALLLAFLVFLGGAAYGVWHPTRGLPERLSATTRAPLIYYFRESSRGAETLGRPGVRVGRPRPLPTADCRLPTARLRSVD